MTKDDNGSIHMDVNAESDSTNQHSSQDNLCYRDDDCKQSNEGGQVEGKTTPQTGSPTKAKTFNSSSNSSPLRQQRRHHKHQEMYRHRHQQQAP
jgi:hypothetical protein